MPHSDPEVRRAYQREYQKRYLRDNPEARKKHLDRVNRNTHRYRQEAHDWVDAYLKDHPCVDCGEPDPIVLEFDHVNDDKLYNVGDMFGRGFSLRKIQAEIAKCEVRCANCHRRVTYTRRNHSSTSQERT